MLNLFFHRQQIRNEVSCNVVSICKTALMVLVNVRWASKRSMTRWKITSLPLSVCEMSKELNYPKMTRICLLPSYNVPQSCSQTSQRNGKNLETIFVERCNFKRGLWLSSFVLSILNKKHKIIILLLLQNVERVEGDINIDTVWVTVKRCRLSRRFFV